MNGKKLFCGEFVDEYPEEAVRIVEEWSKEHTPKTNAQKFEEVFGKPVAADGAGNRCAPFVNVCIHRECSACNEWWDEPYKEPKHVPEPYDGILSDDLFPDIPVEKKKFTEGYVKGYVRAKNDAITAIRAIWTDPNEVEE